MPLEIERAIIPSAEGINGTAVNARELHQFLKVGKDFSNWIKGRIAQFGFQEGTDFVVFAKTGENLPGGRPSTEYALSLDMAKELAMVERTPKGREARQYFIEMEKAAINQKSLAVADAEKVLENQAALMRKMQRLSRKNAKLMKEAAKVPETATMRRYIEALESTHDYSTILEQSAYYELCNRSRTYHSKEQTARMFGMSWDQINQALAKLGFGRLDQSKGLTRAYEEKLVVQLNTSIRDSNGSYYRSDTNLYVTVKGIVKFWAMIHNA